MPDTLARDRLYVTVDLMILTVEEGRLKLLLSRRPAPPFAGRWALPGRFVGLGESAEEAADALLREMLPIGEAFLEQLYTFSDVGRDPRGRVVSMAYLVVGPMARLAPLLEGEGAKMRAFALEGGEDALLEDAGGLRLALEDLAFDHGRIIATGLARLRGKIDYTDIAFHFLEDPGSFSLGELQTVFEAVLGRKVDASNFRRSILGRYAGRGRLEPTDRESRQKRGRPAALYRWLGKETAQGGDAK